MCYISAHIQADNVNHHGRYENENVTSIFIFYIDMLITIL